MIELTRQDAPNGTVITAGVDLWGVSPSRLIEDGADLSALPEAPRIILRSRQTVDDAESSFASWSNAAWERFESLVTDASAALRAARPTAQLLLWPGPGSVLSDGVSTLSFARKHPGIGLIIEPAAWITPAMLRDAEDHLRRFAHALSLCESLEAVAISPVPGLDPAACENLLAPAIERAGAILR
ncbi:MAG: hypothetical protein D6692_03480 [Planctomycetota bacterium]|nr:MAG: hypothetical protein D6692_03480 [Planctomycetota bacterium]